MCVVCGMGCECVCVGACERACVRVLIISNDSCIGLGYDSGASRTILGNMITHAHGTHAARAHISNA